MVDVERTITKKPTQKEMILHHLQTGKTITQREAIQSPINCYRLGARIWDLQQDGHNIEREMISKNGSTFARYYLTGQGA